MYNNNNQPINNTDYYKVRTLLHCMHIHHLWCKASWQYAQGCFLLCLMSHPTSMLYSYPIAPEYRYFSLKRIKGGTTSNQRRGQGKADLEIAPRNHHPPLPTCWRSYIWPHRLIPFPSRPAKCSSQLFSLEN